jgi:hypothetical protein
MTSTLEAPHSLGAGMQGMGAGVMSIVDEVNLSFDQVTYVEIGVYDGITLAEVAIRIACDRGVSWRAIGIDLPDCRHETTRRHSQEKGLIFDLVRPPLRKAPKWGAVTFVLKDSHSFLGEYGTSIGQIHLALIDGCHGKPCVSLDFLLLEPLIVPGGIVMFHDFGADQIGQEQSPPDHCAIVGVHDACASLGLLDNTRDGWRFVQTIIGDKQAGSADMGVFQKL